MMCIACGAKTRVTDSRPANPVGDRWWGRVTLPGPVVWRRRTCTKCGTKFQTEERAVELKS